jgi:soluble lytic murein transglycosylase
MENSRIGLFTKKALPMVSALALALVQAGCLSSSKKAMVPELIGDSTLEALMNERAPAQAPSDEEGASFVLQAVRFCEQYSDFCENTRTRSPREAKIKLKLKEHSQLVGLSTTQALKVFEKLKPAERLKFATGYSEFSGCEHLEPRYALALILEKNFPAKDYVEASQSLYKTNFVCPPHERRSLSIYRAALHEINAGRLAEALAIIESLPTGEKHLDNRLYYWANYCREKLNKELVPAPIIGVNYHEIENSRKVGNDPWRDWLARTYTPIQKRHESDHILNLALEIGEGLLRNDKGDQLRTFLQRWNTAKVQAQSAEMQIYIAYLHFKADLHLKQFQILNPILASRPELITRTLLQIQFPIIYLDEIKSQQPLMEPLFVLSLIRQESAFQTLARSSRGASGLMQLMPSTAKKMDRRLRTADLKQPTKNIELGVRYLNRLMEVFGGDMVKVLGAYNAGGSRIREWEQRYQTTNPLLFADLMPYQETRDYVALIFRNFEAYQALTRTSEVIGKAAFEKSFIAKTEN